MVVMQRGGTEGVGETRGLRDNGDRSSRRRRRAESPARQDPE